MNTIPEHIAKQLEELAKENKGIKTTFYVNVHNAIVEKVESEFLNGTSKMKPNGFLNSQK